VTISAKIDVVIHDTNDKVIPSQMKTLIEKENVITTLRPDHAYYNIIQPV
jgi:hypothetical protein